MYVYICMYVCMHVYIYIYIYIYIYTYTSRGSHKRYGVRNMVPGIRVIIICTRLNTPLN